MSHQSRKRYFESDELDASDARNEGIVPLDENDTRDDADGSAAATQQSAQQKRRKKKQERRLEEQTQVAQRERNSLAAMRSIYALPMRLLILDLNKVLLYRTKGSDRFVPRPYAVRFLQSMAQRFVLAVWTSMKRNSGHRVLSELFDRHRIPLLFVWFQTRCVAEYREEQQQQQTIENTERAEETQKIASGAVDHSDDDEGEEITRETADQAENSSRPFEQRRPSYWGRLREEKRQRKLHSIGLGNGEEKRESAREKVRINFNEKPIFHKPLQHVWRDYPFFGEHNTILLDDTKDKCVTNNEFNCVHPAPFELNITQLEFDVVYSRPDCRQPLPTDDAELAPEGKLWTHLDAIARFEGSLKEFYETHGPYERDAVNEQQDAHTAETPSTA